MTGAQQLLALLLLLLLCLFLFVPLGVFIVIGSPLLITLWLIFMIVFTGLILKHSIYFMKSGKMVLISCFANIFDLYSPQIKFKNGSFNSGILVTVPFMVQRQILPIGAFLVSLQSNTANTKDDREEPTAAVRVFVHIQVKLKQDLITLRRLIHLLGGAGTHANFTEVVLEDRYVAQDNSLLPQIVREKCARIAQFLRVLLQTPFDEAVGQAVATYTLAEALANAGKIQDMILGRLNSPGTVFHDHGVLECFDVFDINIIAIGPTDQKTSEAIAARVIAVRQGKAKIATAEAEAEATIIAAGAEATKLQTVGATLQDKGAATVFAGETLRGVKNLNVITGVDPLTAAANLLVAKEAGQPPTPPQPPTAP